MRREMLGQRANNESAGRYGLSSGLGRYLEDWFELERASFWSSFTLALHKVGSIIGKISDFADNTYFFWPRN
jgi:hypothetical protein